MTGGLGQQESAPEGRCDLSPTLQRWEKWEARPSPGGTTEVPTQTRKSGGSPDESLQGRHQLSTRAIAARHHPGSKITAAKTPAAAPTPAAPPAPDTTPCHHKR